MISARSPRENHKTPGTVDTVQSVSWLLVGHGQPAEASKMPLVRSRSSRTERRQNRPRPTFAEAQLVLTNSAEDWLSKPAVPQKTSADRIHWIPLQVEARPDCFNQVWLPRLPNVAAKENSKLLTLRPCFPLSARTKPTKNRILTNWAVVDLRPRGFVENSRHLGKMRRTRRRKRQCSRNHFRSRLLHRIRANQAVNRSA
jgi:hypothetical protein